MVSGPGDCQCLLPKVAQPEGHGARKDDWVPALDRPLRGEERKLLLSPVSEMLRIWLLEVPSAIPSHPSPKAISVTSVWVPGGQRPGQGTEAPGAAEAHPSPAACTRPLHL